MEIKVIFLGTSAHIPSVTRNHPAILIVYGGENILVDCGEGTQRQFRMAKLNPCKITRILITHKHGDHIFGLPGLLATLDMSGYNKKLVIYGPKGIKKFLNNFLNIENYKLNFEIKIEEVSGKFFETKDFYLEAERMEHAIPCNAYCFVKKGLRKIDKDKLKKLNLISGPHLAKLKQGKNISFKGKKYLAKNLTYFDGNKKISIVMDTLNNKRIIPFVKNSDLLICESSFGDELRTLAKKYFHLTAKQAGEIAKQAEVKKLFLTHIGERYEKNFNFVLNQAKRKFKKSFLAKDLDVEEI